MPLTVGSLFSGIGGIDLGLERAGMKVLWQVEIDPWCRTVLAKHWPDVERFEDVRDVGAANLRPVDLIAGGFPCQDISWASPTGTGLDGSRSGLWAQFRRIIGELRPRYVLVENVAALARRGLSRVLADLAALGFDAEWSDLSACSMGAPHTRRRLFVVAHANSLDGRSRLWHSAARSRWQVQAFDGFAGARAGWETRMANPSALYGNADGVPYRMDRNRGVGNAVVPQVIQEIGRRIVEAEQAVTK